MQPTSRPLLCPVVVLLAFTSASVAAADNGAGPFGVAITAAATLPTPRPNGAAAATARAPATADGSRGGVGRVTSRRHAGGSPHSPVRRRAAAGHTKGPPGTRDPTGAGRPGHQATSPRPLRPPIPALCRAVRPADHRSDDDPGSHRLPLSRLVRRPR